MYYYLNDWKIWLLSILIIIFILWFFFGGKKCEFIGVKPLSIGVDSSKYIDENMFSYKDSFCRTTTPIPRSIPVTPINSPSLYTDIETENESVSEIAPVSPPYDKNLDNNLQEVYRFNIDNHQQSDFENIDLTPNLPPNFKYDNNFKKSKGEIICCQSLSEMFNKPFSSHRPNFLKNPETGRNLEIDCYNDELKMGVEYNGKHHYVWPNFTGQTKESFIKQLERDKLKKELCDQNGVYLITVPYTVKHKDIKRYIEQYLYQFI
jgi:hypothetical protein